MVESRQRSLNATTDADMDIKSRRISRGNDFLQSNSSRNSIQQALNLPRQLWTSLSIEQRKAFLAHKRAAPDGNTLSEDRHKDILAGSSDNDGGQRKRKKKKIRAIKVQRSVSQPDDPSTEDVHIVMKSDDDYSSSSDDSASPNSSTDIPATKKVKTNKVLRKNSTSIIVNANEAFPFATILDTGTEWSVIGGPA